MTMPQAAADPAVRRFMWSIAAALLIPLMLAIPGYHFADNPYREDEAWRVYLALINTIPENVIWSSRSIHPPLWQIGFDVWVELAGDAEPVTRWQSALYAALTLAFVFRLGADLFNRHTGLLALLMLGTLPLFAFFAYEIRPYPLLVMLSAALPLLLLRWLRQPTFKHALWFTLAGIGILYTHFYGLFLVASLALVGLMLVRWQPKVYLRAFGLLALIGLSFTGWLLPLLHAALVTRPGGIGYAVEPELSAMLSLVATDLSTNPALLGALLLALALISPMRTPAINRLRFGAGGRKFFLLVLLLVLIALVFGSNAVVRTLTSRNMIVIAPLLALILGWALSLLPWRMQLLLVGVFAISAVSDFRAFRSAPPYLDLTAYLAPRYQPASPFVIQLQYGSSHTNALYYLRHRLPHPVLDAHSFHIAVVNRQYPSTMNMPEIPTRYVSRADAASLGEFADFLALPTHNDRLWYLRSERGIAIGSAYQAALREQYALLKTTAFGNLLLDEYRRIPPDMSAPAVFGDFTLFNWALLTDVHVPACGSVTLESWWRAAARPDDNYSMTLVLVGSAGTGIANTDSEPAALLTLQWQPGQAYLDARTLTVPCDAPPGAYPLMVNLYSPQDGAPLGSLFYLTTIHVP